MKALRAKSNLSRRDFLATTAAAVAAGGVMGAGCMDELMGKKAKKIPVGLQLYSVRADCAKDLPGTIEKVAKMGYDGVEFAGYYDYKAADLRKLLDDNGLVCCGTHTAMDTLSDANLAATIEFNQTLGNKYLIVPWLKPDDSNPKAAWRKHAERFNELAERVTPEGMVVGYHCHAHDFHTVEGEVPWEILFDNTRPEVAMQLDTGNAMSGGGDPVKYLKKYPGRAVTVHIKEYSETNKNALIGEGDLSWQEIFSLCETIGGTRWYIIEEEKDAYPPLEGVDLSLQNYRKLRA
ncbi:MAG: sugar phosphate isomerase/epimerase [Sedimentisphaerales bacterium]|nr:sugar phosphate isomerase/epimerase [Sedimentisphaerales bacterium]